MLNFESFGLPEPVLEAVRAMNFETPTPIQAESIPVLMSDEVDMIGLAQTGTGKTAAYGLPLLSKIDPSLRETQAIILCPTRELCMQVAEELQKFAQFMPMVHILPIYGGVSIERQITALRKGVQIIVATPGRIIDHLERGNARLLDIRYLILDEADKMLEMGFKEPIEEIMAQTNETKRTWLYSATMPTDIRRIASQFMHNPAEVTIGRKNTTAENVTHLYYMAEGSARFETLQRIIDFNPDIYGIIFTRTKNEAQETAEQLIKNGYNADALHGDLAQGQRDRVMKMFRERTLQLLVATDVAARGLDVNNLTHVINYGVPDELDSYIHRSGRTARAGKKGTAITIVTPSHRRQLDQLERMIGAKIERNQIPTAQEVINRRFEYYIEQFQTVEFDATKVEGYVQMFLEKAGDMTKEEILQRVSHFELNRYMEYYKNAVDLNRYDRRDRREAGSGYAYDDRRQGGNDRNDRGRDRNDRNDRSRDRFTRNDSGSQLSDRYRRFYINLGAQDGFDKMTLLGWLSKTTNLPKSHINRVHLNDTHSFFEMFADEAHIAEEAFHNAFHGNRGVKVDLVNDAEKRVAGNFGSERNERPVYDRPYNNRGGGDYNDRKPRRRSYGNSNKGNW